jgi:AAA domain
VAKSMASLRSTQSTNPPVCIFYGVDKVGKTSLAAQFPDPVYLNTNGERPPNDVELATFGEIETLDDVFDSIQALLTEPHDRKTLIVDSLDGLEPIMWAATCKRIGVSTIEEAGYGKGYVEADVEWNEYLQAVGALAAAGIAVVQLAHPEIIRFDSPTTDPYSRYTIKLHKRAAALVREKADIIGFLNYRVTLKEKEVAPKKSVAHAESGGDRNIHLEERAGFIAGNRYSMPPSVPFKKGAGYSAISQYFPAPTGIIAEEK